ncbi:MAG: insulinase family protein [Kiritimatiellae bacterium]|nr:insulinase family protein [Kiritimatiellia bacterium]
MKLPEIHTLPGGLRVVLVPCEAESVAFGLFVASGSRHEGPKDAGISHFIEHMLFKGTPTRRPLDITRAIEGRGGMFNAYTGEESTCYYAHLPDEYLADAVDILADMYLNAAFPESEFVREKQVVLEEIKMYGDDPESVVMENLQRALFPGHPLGNPVAGSASSLAPMTPARLKSYLAGHYLPGNTVAVVVGRFDTGKALDLVGAALECRRRAKPRRARESGPAALPPLAEISASKDVVQTQLAIGYRTFGINDPRKYAATVMDAVLGRGMSSRLFQEVREKRGLSYDISSRMQFFSDAGMFTVSAGLDGAKRALAEKTIMREIARMKEKTVGAAELNRTKEFLIGNFRLAHERITAKLFYYGSTMLSFGRLVPTQEQVEGIRRVTAADVRDVANAMLDDSSRSVSLVVPR